jgi:tRNA dimethylallyltransferase
MTILSSPPTIVLVGPTAAGKTDVAHEITRRMGWGVISADAMMVYRGMDIGTAKPTADERGSIPYAGIDITTPDTSFNAHDYLAAVNRQTAESNSNMSWMVAGGTGLYIRCLLKGLDEQDGADNKLRETADAVLANEGFEALKNWCRMQRPGIDQDLPAGDLANPRRWIRAVERGTRLSSPVGATHLDRALIVGLQWERDILEKRIIQRVEKMYENGLLDEVKQLRLTHDRFSPTAGKAIGYAEALAVIDGRMKLNDARNQTIIRTRQYAKRQMTWFRNQLPTQWIEVTATDSIGDLADKAMARWKSHGH